MLIILVVHQLYQAFMANNWTNPLIYLLLAVETFSGGAVVVIGMARALDKRLLFRACVIGLAAPWGMGILYMIYGFSQLASIPYAIYKVAPLGKFVVSESFWWWLVTSVVTAIFWTAVGNSLRKSTTGLATKKAEDRTQHAAVIADP
jgi:hypothetical protein